SSVHLSAGPRCYLPPFPTRRSADLDLDPGEGLDFGDVKSAAKDIHDRLADIGLTSFAMLTGGKGVHLVVPLTTGHSWDEHKDFRSEEHTSELQSRENLVCRLLLETK